MVNNYCRLPHARTAIAGVGASTTDDATILQRMGSAAREIEAKTGRRFYSEIATRLFDGDGSPSLWLPDDLLSVTTLKIDEDGDGTHELTLTSDVDYWLYPDNKTPKYRIDLNPDGSTLTRFPRGRRRIQVVGSFGHSEQTDATAITGTVADGTTTTLTASADASAIVYAGDTIIVESEQMYVTAVATTAITVVRGVNGTTAAAHSTKAIAIRRYPEDIEAAAIVRVADLFRGAQTGYSGQVGGSEFGGFSSNTAYAQFMGLIGSYRMMVVA